VTPTGPNADAGGATVLRVLRGTPDEEELAAVLAVLQLLAGQAGGRSLAVPAALGWTRPARYRPPAAWT